MDSKTEKLTAYCIAIILFIVGMVCYAVSDTTPDIPVRIMFEGGNGGSVLFDHMEHYSAEAYGFDCIDCHHYFEEDYQDKPESCIECHELDSDDEEMPKRSDAFHSQCIGCHEDDGTAPLEKECSGCHVI